MRILDFILMILAMCAIGVLAVYVFDYVMTYLDLQIQLARKELERLEREKLLDELRCRMREHRQ